MKRLLAVVLFLVATGQLLHLRSPASGKERKPLQRISVEEIGKSVVLIGRLGAPLGEKIKITGNWHFPTSGVPKDASIRFTVTAVNGEKLAKPIEFNHGQLSFSDREDRNVIPAFEAHEQLDGQTWTLIAYETGRIGITPDEYGDKSPVFPVVQLPYYTRPFTSELVGVVQRKQERSKP